jgi:hypothetical protein
MDDADGNFPARLCSLTPPPAPLARLSSTSAEGDAWPTRQQRTRLGGEIKSWKITFALIKKQV